MADAKLHYFFKTEKIIQASISLNVPLAPALAATAGSLF